jgi:RNA polymerase sigma factor (sigma-70 family)
MADDPPKLSMIDPRDDEVVREVQRLAREVSKDPVTAKDISQTVLAKLVQMLNNKGLDALPVENRGAYLRTAVKREMIDLFKKTGSGKGVSLDDETLRAKLPSAGPDQEHDILLKERRIILSELMRELNDEENEMLYLLILNYNQKEIALRLGISYELARVRVHRLKVKLESQIRARLKYR